MFSLVQEYLKINFENMRSHLVDLGQIQDPLLDHPATKAEVDLADLLPGRDQKLKAELNLGFLLQFRSSHGFGLFLNPL